MRPPRGVARATAADVVDVVEPGAPAKPAGQSEKSGRNRRRGQAAGTGDVVFSARGNAMTGRRRLRKQAAPAAAAGTAAAGAPCPPSAAAAGLEDLALKGMPELMDAPDDPDTCGLLADIRSPSEAADELLGSVPGDLCNAAAVGNPPAENRRPRRTAAYAAAAVAAAAASNSDQELGDGQSDSPLVVKRRPRNAAVKAAAATTAAAAAADGDSDQELEDDEKVAKGNAWFTEAELERMIADTPLAANLNTNKQYKSVAKHFVVWCQYQMQEGKEPKAREMPYAPDLNGPDGADKAARFLSWYVEEGHPGLLGTGHTVYKSDSMLKRVHGCLQSMWALRAVATRLQQSRDKRSQQQKQQQQQGKGGLLLDPVYQLVYKRCQGLYKPQKGVMRVGADGEPVDPQDYCQETTFNEDELVRICDHLLSSTDPKDALQMSMLLLMVGTAGRGDDCRDRFICELLPPMLRRCIGPSPAWVMAFLQTHGKTLGDGSATRGCLRHKVALLDPQGATGRYFVTRFTLGGEVWPGPLDKELKTKRLFPSVRKGKDAPLPYNTHNKRDKELFRKLDIYIMKTTHASRVYAARAGDEAGLSDEEIARLGMWNLTALQLFYMLTGLKPSTLLAMGRWDPNKPFDQYWREAMEVIVPERFIHLLLPFYAAFKAEIDALTAAGASVPTCARSLAELLPFLAFVVVQEALELCGDDRPERYKENPVHKLLLADQEFREMLAKYNADKALGVFEANRPLTNKQMLGQLLERQHTMWQHMNQQLRRIASGQAGQLVSQQLQWAQVSEEDEVAQLAEAVQQAQEQQLQSEGQAAAASPEFHPSEEAALRGTTAEGASAAVKPRRHRLGRQQEQQPGASAACTGVDTTTAMQSSVKDDVDAAAAAAPGDNGTISAGLHNTGDEDDVQVAMEIELPADDTSPAAADDTSPAAADQKFYTPGGKFRSLSDFRSRGLLSPRGQHQYAWFSGQVDCSAQHHSKRLELQPWRQQPPDPVPLQQQQTGSHSMQQQLVPRQQFEQLVRDLVQQEFARQQQVQHDSTEQQQLDQGHSQKRMLLVSEQQLKQVMGDALRSQMMQLQAQQSLQQERQPDEVLVRLLNQTHAGDAAAAGSNPMSFLQPTIQQLPATAAALRGENSRYDASNYSDNNSSRQVYALAQLIAVKAAGYMLQLQQPPVAGASAQRSVAPATVKVQPGSAATAGAAPATAAAAAAAGCTVTMSDWDTFAQFDAWADQVPQGCNKSRRVLEEEDDNSWWKAAGIRKQRISDYRKLLKLISTKAAELTAAVSSRSTLQK